MITIKFPLSRLYMKKSIYLRTGARCDDDVRFAQVINTD
jgi:hypothetical protein